MFRCFVLSSSAQSPCAVVPLVARLSVGYGWQVNFLTCRFGVSRDLCLFVIVAMMAETPCLQRGSPLFGNESKKPGY
jgi:hypothetical protein